MKKVIFVVVACIFVIGIFDLVTRFPLNIVVDRSRATAHMELLGQYPNNVYLIELEQTATSRVIWRVVAIKNMFQLTYVDFVVGSNNANLITFQSNSARTEIPLDSAEFVLVPDADYKLKVCPSSWWQRCVSEVFRLSGV